MLYRYRRLVQYYSMDAPCRRGQNALRKHCTRMLWVILNKFWKQHSTKQQLYRHLSPITKTIQVKRTRYAGHCWRIKDEPISNVLLWNLTCGFAVVGWLATALRGHRMQFRGPGGMDEERERERGGRGGKSVLAARLEDDDDLCSSNWCTVMSKPSNFKQIRTRNMKVIHKNRIFYFIELV